MLWESLLVGRLMSDEDLRHACAAALGIDRQRVWVQDRIEDAPPPGAAQIGLVVERYSARGEFPLALTLYVSEPALQPAIGDAGQSFALLLRICRSLAADCLISDDSSDPYAMLRMRATGDVEFVEIDPDLLDDSDAFVAASVLSPAPAGSD